MPMNITACDSIIEKVTEQLAEEDAHNRRKIEKANPFIGVPIAADLSRLGEENGGAYIDADCPGEYEQTDNILVSTPAWIVM